MQPIRTANQISTDRFFLDPSINCCLATRQLMPPSDEGGGQPSGCSEGEKTERYRFCRIISKKPTVFLSLSRLRRQLPHQREPWFAAPLNSSNFNLSGCLGIKNQGLSVRQPLKRSVYEITAWGQPRPEPCRHRCRCTWRSS